MPSSLADPCNFNVLKDDNLQQIIEYVGKKSFFPFSLINKQCNHVFRDSNFPKESFRYTCAPPHLLLELYPQSLPTAVVTYNRGDILEYALHIKEDKVMVHDICQKAVMEDRLDILHEIFEDSKLNQEAMTYLKESELCKLAAENGQLKSLKYLRSQGCKWNKRTALVARLMGFEELYEWLIDNGCPEYDGEHFIGI